MKTKKRIEVKTQVWGDVGRCVGVRKEGGGRGARKS